MTKIALTTAIPATMQKFDSYLVSEVEMQSDIGSLFPSRPESVEMLAGSFMVERLSNATVIIHSGNDDLPFRGIRLMCEGYVPATFYGSDRKGYVVTDRPDPAVAVDDLNEEDRARVREGVDA